MNAECPRCATSDETVGVPHAVNDPAHPLRAPEAGLLLPPPPPAPAAVERSTPAITLYAAAGLILVYWIATVGKGLEDLSDAGSAYRMGYLFGPLVFVVPLALTGLIVQLTTGRGRARAAEDTARIQRTVWERRYWVWLQAHLCRRCRVAFFPKGSLGPAFAGSPVMEVAQLPGWVTTTAANLGLDAPSPTAPR